MSARWAENWAGGAMKAVLLEPFGLWDMASGRAVGFQLSERLFASFLSYKNEGPSGKRKTKSQQVLKIHWLMSHLHRALQSDTFIEINERPAYGF